MGIFFAILVEIEVTTPVIPPLDRFNPFQWSTRNTTGIEFAISQQDTMFRPTKKK